MRIIRAGKKVVGVMRVICRRCEAELELEAGDLKKEPGNKKCDPVIYSYKCPCCYHNNFLEYSDLSEEILCNLEN